MTVEQTQDAVLDHAGDVAGQLAKYGIAHASQDVFTYGGYRYTNLKDAIAEAQRHPPHPA
jgi:hypothetical protein